VNNLEGHLGQSVHGYALKARLHWASLLATRLRIYSLLLNSLCVITLSCKVAALALLVRMKLKGGLLLSQLAGVFSIWLINSPCAIYLASKSRQKYLVRERGVGEVVSGRVYKLCVIDTRCASCHMLTRPLLKSPANS